MNKTKIKSLKQTIRLLTEEAAECTTDAARRCVEETLAVKQRELAEELKG